MRSAQIRVTGYVPCYNARATIQEAVRSILDQSVPVSEIFVVDDGSADGSGDLASVPVIRLDTNAGRGAVRARAMSQATSELVLGCDATLMLDPMFLENALPWFASDRVAAVFGRIKHVEVRTAAARWRGRHLFHCELAHGVVHRASFATGCSIVRKDAVRQAGGFNPALRSGEDADLGRRLLDAGFDVVFDPKLFATTAVNNSLREVLERYARWNTRERMKLKSYLRQVSYALKVMVAKDLREKDFSSACISLLAPHYQFWWTNNAGRR
jgi:cellulose synthase/poly-beta-1,6-N-acetylglucosamine synthase-like glycosyltransferase